MLIGHIGLFSGYHIGHWITLFIIGESFMDSTVLNSFQTAFICFLLTAYGKILGK